MKQSFRAAATRGTAGRNSLSTRVFADKFGTSETLTSTHNSTARVTENCTEKIIG